MRAEALAEIAKGRAAFDALEAIVLVNTPEIAAAPVELPPALPQAAAPGLLRPGAFYDHLRKAGLLGSEISTEEFTGCETILAAAAGKLPMSWAAYCLGTAFHETGGVMAPNIEDLNYSTAARIKEVWPSRFPTVASAQPFVHNAKGLANHVYNGRMGNRPGTNDGWDHRGRGQAHLTGREMYAKLDVNLGLGGALIRNPDLAMRPDISAQVLVVGMLKGLFTAKKKDGLVVGNKLNDFIAAKPTTAQFSNARIIINPDKNGPKVAAAAEVFFSGLQAGGWQ